MNQKRIITVLAGSAMLAGLLTGCGAEPGIGKSEEPVNLTVWTYYNAGYGAGAGFGYLHANVRSSNAGAYFGFRLCRF